VGVLREEERKGSGDRSVVVEKETEIMSQLELLFNSMGDGTLKGTCLGIQTSTIQATIGWKQKKGTGEERKRERTDCSTPSFSSSSTISITTPPPPTPTSLYSSLPTVSIVVSSTTLFSVLSLSDFRLPPSPASLSSLSSLLTQISQQFTLSHRPSPFSSFALVFARGQFF
jgi:hypothetical protein